MAAAEDLSKPILLLIDGHDSHESLAIKKAIYDNQGDHQFIILCFPSKCTHKLQPLDVAVFNHTQTNWKKRVDQLTDKNIPMTCYNVIHEYMGLRDKFMTPKIIKDSFRKTGISPFNPDIFTKEDYAPSQTFSIKAHVPETYPDAVPSSDPEIPTENERSDSDLDSGSDLDLDYQGHGLETPMDDQGGNTSDDDTMESSTTDFMDSDSDSPTTPTPAYYTTRSTSRSLSARLADPIPAISLDKLQKLSSEDLVSHNLNMQGRVLALEHELQMANAMRQSSESHCTLAVRMIEDVNIRLDNANKKRNHGTIKTKAWVVVAPDLKELFEQEEREAERGEAERTGKGNCDSRS